MNSGQGKPAGRNTAMLEPPLADPPRPLSVSVASRLVRGSIIYTAATFALRGLSFFLVALYTRFLTPADFGSVALAETIGVLLATVAALGVNGSIGRLYFQYVDDPEALRGYVGSVAWFTAATGAGLLSVALLLGPPVLRLVAPHFSLPFYPYVALAIGAALANQLIELRLGIYRAEGRPRAHTWYSAAVFVLTAGAVIACVVAFRWGALGMLLGKLAGALLALGVTALVSGKWLRGRWNRIYIRETLSLGLPLVPHQLMALALVAADRFILDHYRSLTEVGLYSVAYTIGMAMYLITSSLMQAWSPLFFDAVQGRKLSPNALGRMSTALVVLLCAMAVTGSLVAPDFVRLFLNARYQEAGRLVPWIIAAYLLHGLFSLFQLSFLQGKQTGMLWVLSAIALAGNLAGNFLLVPRWGAYGAAWATLIGYGIEAVLAYIWAQKIYRVGYSPARVLLALAAVAGALVWSQSTWAEAGHPAVALSLVMVAGLALWLVSGVKVAEMRLLWSSPSS